MIIDIVRQRTAKLGQHSPLSQDVGPGGLLVPQLPMQNPTAVIVDGRALSESFCSRYQTERNMLC